MREFRDGESLWPDVPLDSLLDFFGVMRFGLTLREDSIFELLSAYGLPKTLVAEQKQADTADLGLELRAFGGLVGDPDEIETAAEAMMKAADEETFTNIREFIRFAPWMYSLLPAALLIMFPDANDEHTVLRTTFTNGRKMLRNPHYRLLIFVIMVRRAQIKNDRGRGAATLAHAVLTPLRQLLTFVISDRDTRALVHELSVHFGILTDFPGPELFAAVASRGADAKTRGIIWKLIRRTWRHGLSDLWKLRNPLRPRAVVREKTAG